MDGIGRSTNKSALSVVAALLVLLFLAYTTLSYHHNITVPHAAIASDEPRCSKVGLQVFRKGGNVVDAAVAVSLCLGVLDPSSSGIGGGGFMLVRYKRKAKVIDMREVAPSAASENMYHGNESLKEHGPLSVAVPGELAGLHKAWELYGNLPWDWLILPAEYFASQGFNISENLHDEMTIVEDAILADKEGLAKVFAPNGSILKVGDICKNVKLGETLRKIRIYGPSVFYRGSVGTNFIDDLYKAGGIMTRDDLKNYTVKLRDPIRSSINISGARIDLIGVPPPTTGTASMVLILNILSHLGYAISPGDLPYARIHKKVESLKHAFAVRMHLGDPDFVNITDVLSDMLSPSFAANLSKTIFDNMTFDPYHYGGKWGPYKSHEHGTSHFCIVGPKRNAVTMTTTINYYFGARFMSPSTGIIYNNQMDDFSMPMNQTDHGPPPAPTNYISPHKRPLSSSTPVIFVKNGRLKYVIGASGGRRIIAATMEVFLNHYVDNWNALYAVDNARFYHQLFPNVVEYENWTTAYGNKFEVCPEVINAMEERNHSLKGLDHGAICQFIVHELDGPYAGNLTAVSDPRKGGEPFGY